jgi:shikimate kinase/3-dehydroquinate synthase
MARSSTAVTDPQAPAARPRALSHATDAPRRALVLIGFMGAGKSTIATELAESLGVRPLDSDLLLEERLGHSITREIELHGEPSFRVKEEALVCELLAEAGPGAVIALGGGSVLSERVRRALDPHLTIFLDVDPGVAWERVRAADAAGLPGRQRPLARDRATFSALHTERRALYEDVADAFVPALARGTAPRLLEGLRLLAEAPAGTRLLWASAASGDYPVFLARGLLDDGGTAALERIWPLDRSLSRPFCVTDEAVASRYLERLGQLRGTVAIAPGEGSKTLAGAERVWHALAAAEITRADHLIALGGGVVGDLAGFCAATCQRGVPVVQVPTSLVAQVDSAYGGKTGVDLPAAKNYVGVYHHPAGVIVDPGTLATLPAGELAAGWVEVLKTALIAGGQLWERVADGGEVDEWTILSCARTKLAIVAEDERDGGRRQALNLGHTLGHAIETATGYARYRHGEAVGLGLLAALRLSGQDALRARVRELLLARGLPVTLAGADVQVEELIAATARDKKRVGAHVPFVLLAEPGEARTGCEIAGVDLHAAVRELLA